MKFILSLKNMKNFEEMPGRILRRKIRTSYEIAKVLHKLSKYSMLYGKIRLEGI